MLTWTIRTRILFDNWLETQNYRVKKKVLSMLLILSEYGPHLGRPYADRLKLSKFIHMKELRIQVSGVPIRVCFAFDPRSCGIVLCAGNKKGCDENQFYIKLIKSADAEYASHLVKPEGLWVR